MVENQICFDRIFAKKKQEMTAVELKKVLIHKITEINDVSFLEAIMTILDSKTGSRTIILSPEQQQEIIDSKKEVENGQYFDHDSLNKEVSEWLNAK